LIDDKLPEDGKIGSKKKKKAIAERVQVNNHDAKTDKFNSKKTRPGVRYVSPYFHTDSVKKINVRPLDKGSTSESIALPSFGNLMGDKMEDDDNGKQIDRQRVESDVDSGVLMAMSGDFFENEVKENGNEFKIICIKSKKKKSDSQKNFEESAKVEKVRPNFWNDCEKKAVSDIKFVNPGPLVHVWLLYPFIFGGIFVFTFYFPKALKAS